MRTARRLPVSLCVACLLAPTASAQNPVTDAPPLLHDPVSQLLLAFPVNGLHGLDGKPWHIHASFQVLDDKKQPVDSGTLEEWWAGAEKYKIALESRRIRQTRYVLGGRIAIVGSQMEPDYPFNLMIPALQNPLPDEAWAALMTLSWQHTRMRDEELDCIVAQSPLTDTARNGSGESRYCFQQSSPAVRLSFLGATSYAYDSITQFDGRFVAQGIRIASAGKLASEVDVHVDSLDDLGPVSNADFSPPVAGAGSAEPLGIPGRVIQGNRISGKEPKYSGSARARRIQGTVVLLATIGKDGKLTDLEVVSGPPELQEPSLKAVRTWRYRPYLLNGDPVEVETQINVNFQLGR
ncbi:MAG TPA: energy transducer TonB [Acidobacteriaceae bacterium]|nr:energy transducer TonB [Acidobacteriaceae bacterium]